jgi:hypothetical protein
MLDAFGVGFSSFDGYAQCDKYIHDEPMPGSYACRQLQSAFRQEDTTIGAGRCHPFPFQPGDGFYGGHMGNAKAACNICRTSLAGAGQEVSDELNVVLKQSCRLSRTTCRSGAPGSVLREALTVFQPVSPFRAGTSLLLAIARASAGLTMLRARERYNFLIKLMLTIHLCHDIDNLCLFCSL